MVALGRALSALIGAAPVVDGLACTPGTGLTVSVAVGAIFASVQTDATSYGSLGTDATTIIKQGLSSAATVLSTPAPAGTGQSINYLVECQYQDVDSGSTLLPYYNAANPTVPYSGPANDGIPQNTIRQGVCAIQIKAGTAAATGSQTTPAVDSGWTPLYVVTVAHSSSVIVTGNITVASGAPFIGLKLAQAVPNNTFLGNISGASAQAQAISTSFLAGLIGAAGGDLTGTFPNPTIAAGAVTGAKTAASTMANSNLAQMAASTVKANVTGSTANASDVSLSSLLTAFGFSASISGTSGYIKFPSSVGGLVIQFGTTTMTSTGGGYIITNVSFSSPNIAFPTAMFGAVGSSNMNNNGTPASSSNNIVAICYNYSTSGFTIRSDSEQGGSQPTNSIFWIAVGN